MRTIRAPTNLLFLTGRPKVEVEPNTLYWKNWSAAKHQAAQRWVAAVNRWGQLGEWDFWACREPQRLAEELAAYD